MKTVAFCEIEPFCRDVLRKHWPDVKQYDDVRGLTRSQLEADGIVADVICGGFPCQDISIAGSKSGLQGARSGLWSELARVVGEVRPRYAIVENVTNLLSGPSDRPGGWFGRVLSDLAAVGYDAEWHCVPASVLGAHFVGDRVWIIATPTEASSSGRQGLRFNAVGENSQWSTDQFEGLVRLAMQHAVPAGKRGRVSDGVSGRVHRLRALGNAVVPQVVELIGRAIMEAQREQDN